MIILYPYNIFYMSLLYIIKDKVKIDYIITIIGVII